MGRYEQNIILWDIMKSIEMITIPLPSLGGARGGLKNSGSNEVIRKLRGIANQPPLYLPQAWGKNG